MKTQITLLVALLSFTLSCSARSESPQVQPAENAPNIQAARIAENKDQSSQGDTDAKSFAEVNYANSVQSVPALDKTESATQAFDRKIIRNADITMDVSSTSEAQHRVTSIIESRGGFVVTSESKQREGTDPAQRTLDIKLIVRIPANQFSATLDEIKTLASNTPQQQVTGQDVTEEFIDLEARLKTQKALEEQFLIIMRKANEIPDALAVQRQIAIVRTEIEKLEGHKRFLENRSSLSTITINLQTPRPILAVTGSGFGQSLRDAVSESIVVASDIVLFLVRFVIVMLPVVLLVFLPTGWVIRRLIRRAKRIRLAQSLATPAE